MGEAESSTQFSSCIPHLSERTTGIRLLTESHKRCKDSYYRYQGEVGVRVVLYSDFSLLRSHRESGYTPNHRELLTTAAKVRVFVTGEEMRIGS